jgi:hypothetical protein
MAIGLRKVITGSRRCEAWRRVRFQEKHWFVYDPVMHLPIDVFPCKDGHTQKRLLLKTVLEKMETCFEYKKEFSKYMQP